ncbi:universal stress protein [Methanohalophilus sp.]|uniref:universal stress protein n=1 Tax=Methanohalophilus sp. TaxID=1966352 RepID=UPI0026332A4F|nr:universal stress protein [Methanohalophilus sp.]MDK2891780.1 hypothetical protein [Methanohalophilus sp.]
MYKSSYEKILIATDGSKNANKAAESGIEIARLSKAKVYALYVLKTDSKDFCQNPAVVDWIEAMKPKTIEDLTDKQWLEIARITDARLKKEHEMNLIRQGEEAIAYVERLGNENGVNVESVLLKGQPAQQIIDFAEKNDVDLVVLGTLGKTADNRFLLGSVAEKVVRNCGVQVLVVR